MSSYFLSALPRCAKFLLIAAYLASNNPSTYDERLFGKSYKQTTRRKPKKSSKNSDAQQTDGPKAFSLDRLLHIYSCISQNDDTFDDKQTTEYVESLYSQPYCSHFYHQISSLVNLRLLLQETTSNNLSKIWYRCCLDLELIEDIAKSVSFPLHNYLLDTRS
jgi:origin recognition complex subunit 5